MECFPDAFALTRFPSTVTADQKESKSGSKLTQTQNHIHIRDREISKTIHIQQQTQWLRRGTQSCLHTGSHLLYSPVLKFKNLLQLKLSDPPFFYITNCIIRPIILKKIYVGYRSWMKKSQDFWAKKQHTICHKSINDKK